MDPNQITEAVNSPVTIWGTIAGAILVAFSFVKTWNVNRKGDNAQIKALLEDNARLENRLRDADKRADEAIDEKDAMSKEINGLIREFAEIKSQYATINERLEWQTKQNDQLLNQNSALMAQNTELSNQVRTLLQQGV